MLLGRVPGRGSVGCGFEPPLAPLVWAVSLASWQMLGDTARVLQLLRFGKVMEGSVLYCQRTSLVPTVGKGIVVGL